MHHGPVHVRQPQIPATMPHDQLRMVNAQRVQHGCVEIVDFDRIFDGVTTSLLNNPVEIGLYEISG